MNKYFLLPFLLLAFAKWSPAQEKPEFQHRPDEEHYVLILLSETWANAREIAGQVARYNQELTANKPTRMQLYRIPFLSQQPVITLTGFPNQQAAEKYCRQLRETNPNFMQMNIVEKVWPVSLYNFNEMLRKKSAAGYDTFLQ